MIIQFSWQLTSHQELWTFIVTNLASVYIREGNRHQEVSQLFPFFCRQMQYRGGYRFDCFSFRLNSFIVYWRELIPITIFLSGKNRKEWKQTTYNYFNLIFQSTVCAFLQFPLSTSSSLLYTRSPVVFPGTLQWGQVSVFQQCLKKKCWCPGLNLAYKQLHVNLHHQEIFKRDAEDVQRWGSKQADGLFTGLTGPHFLCPG